MTFNITSSDKRFFTENNSHNSNVNYNSYEKHKVRFFSNRFHLGSNLNFDSGDEYYSCSSITVTSYDGLFNLWGVANYFSISGQILTWVGETHSWSAAHGMGWVDESLSKKFKNLLKEIYQKIDRKEEGIGRNYHI
jgi:hypothetical protein